jgi:folate-binding protein YgfZ
MPTSTSTVTTTPTAWSFSGQLELHHMGVIRVAGDDAATFLQGQLTQDVLQASLHEARLAAFCNAKGRMQASFVVFKRSPQELLLVCSRDLLATTLKRLSMFVLRAKAQLSDATAEFSLIGLMGEAVAAQGAVGRHTWSKTEAGPASVVVLPAGAGVLRALWCAPAGTPPPAGPAITPQAWAWVSVRSGVAMLSKPIFEAFVPQMLNYESIGGVNFKKGCYPGQEVVARSQFRGTLKRRAYLAHSDGALSCGQEIFHSIDPEQPCGLVAAACAAPDGGCDAIISIQTSASASGSLHAGSAGGATLSLLPLPYPLLEDI